MPVCGNYLFFELPKKIVLNPKDGYGAQGCYWFFALWNGIACVLYLLFGLEKAGENRVC